MEDEVPPRTYSIKAGMPSLSASLLADWFGKRLANEDPGVISRERRIFSAVEKWSFPAWLAVSVTLPAARPVRVVPLIVAKEEFEEAKATGSPEVEFAESVSVVPAASVDASKLKVML